MAVKTIEREHITYLVCNGCGAVFPDRDNPTTCPICAADKSHFTVYRGKRDDER